MTAQIPLSEATRGSALARRNLPRPGSDSLSNDGAAHLRAKLSCRLRRVLAEHPRARTFTVHRIIRALENDGVGAPLALFSAAGMFELPETRVLSAGVVSALGAGLVLGRRTVALPRALLRRKIPRNSLALLIHGIVGLLEAADGALRQRWNWVFHPGMSMALGLMLFLLGLASMTPIVGGGAQHAASAFLIAVGLAERDGLAVMIGAVAGIAAIAVAALSVASGSRLWKKVKAWLLHCASKLRLHALATLLDRCCDGLGELVRLRWGGLLLLILTPVTPLPPRKRGDGSNSGPLRKRARRALIAAVRSVPLSKSPANAT